ncbi:MAG: hypothetical protein P1U56_25340, partial [Saprospiraceae bacterium]|nr:hypothetical protein [Saprospiraceae bacterium]
MNKIVFSILFLFQFMIVASQQTENRFTSVVLAEDEHVCITLHYYLKADIGDPEWLKIEFRNKT